MATRYTDVDQLIFKRWDEVNALRAAFDDLLERMQDVVEVSLQKVSHRAKDNGFESEYDLKRPSIWFWKPEWANRRNEPGVCLFLADFVPADYGRAVRDHPSMWVDNEELSRLKPRDSAEQFGRALRAALSADLLKKWNHEEVDVSSTPLGRDCHEVSESDRVRMVSDPDALRGFLLERLHEFSELVPTVDQALAQLARK
jgi:hypothetical protein